MKTKFFLVIILLSLFAGTSCNPFTPGPAQTVKNFYRAIEAGKIEEAMALLSNRVVQNLGKDKIQRGLTEQAREMKEKGGIQSITIIEEDIVGDTAEISFRITPGNGEVMEETIDMIKENDKWKLDPQK